MNKITYPLKPRQKGNAVANLQEVLLYILQHKRNLLTPRPVMSHVPHPPDWQKLESELRREQKKRYYGKTTKWLVTNLQYHLHLPSTGEVDEATADAINALLEEWGLLENGGKKKYKVKGTIRFADGSFAEGLTVLAFDQDLRAEQLLGKCRTNKKGFYEITYSSRQFCRLEKKSADLVVKVFSDNEKLLAASPTLFNAPSDAKVNLAIPAEVIQPPSLFEKINKEIAPLLGNIKIEELEQDDNFQDVTFLSGETGFDMKDTARFILAHKLVRRNVKLVPEFWFALLGGSFYKFDTDQSLKKQLAEILDALPSLDAAAVRKALIRSFNLNEIPKEYQEKVSEWVEAFLKFVAGLIVSEKEKTTFVNQALEHAGIEGPEKKEKFARLFQEYRAFTPELLKVLEKDRTFKKKEIADLQTSFQLVELTQGDFSVVKAIKEEFGIRQPDKIRLLAKKSEKEWVDLVEKKHAAGEIELPFEVKELPDKMKLPAAEAYGKMLARRFREAFPTTAFAGGLARALANGGVRGLRHAETLGKFLDVHTDFEFLNTPVDDFLEHSVHPDFEAIARDEEFRLEVKAVQRVFKLAPTFDATDALLADGLHSAQQIYRMGKTEFVRRYADRPGFTKDSAELAWNCAAETHAAVLTLVGDLKALDPETLPHALKSGSDALSTFPNWNNLFKGGDLCQCEHCRSVLGPAAYFADLLMFLKDRESTKPKPGGDFYSVKEILFARRPDLGFLELNCDNALTPLPYIDVVCEVLEEAIAKGENDLELIGFTDMPADPNAAKDAVKTAFSAQNIDLGADFSLSQVDPSDPDRWVVHGDDVTYRLKKKGQGNFFAEILRNTKASAEELRAYPQYINPKAYEKLRAARYPSSLPFDLFAEEVRAAFKKCNLQRWDLMRTLRGADAPNNPTDGEIAAEYFGISADPGAAFDEKRLILVADETVVGQKVIWGETGAGWLNKISNVKTFLNKTGLEYRELLALLDLKFINPDGDNFIEHDDPSCDTDKKSIQGLDATKLDCIHRFLRLWRKLKDWKMWELDLVIRHPAIGNGKLDESFLIQLFYLDRLKKKLGRKTTVEQVSALFGNLNTKTHFTKPHKERGASLYQRLFLNRQLIQPLDPAFHIDPVTGDLPSGETITDHRPVVLAGLGIREPDLILLEGLTRASDGMRYITDDLTLGNLSFLWRHAWLAKMLKFKVEDWKILLKIFQQDIFKFDNPQAAWEFLEKIDHIKETGFKLDELDWLLAADRSARAATKESEAARFLTALRKELQAIKAEYDPSQYDFLAVTPPTDVDKLTELLISLLQKLNRDEEEIHFFIATLKDEVNIETTVEGLPAGFNFPDAIKNTIRIRYDETKKRLCFVGLMTDAERTTLLSDPSLASITGIPGYREAIEELFHRPRLALKFFEPVFTAYLGNLPAEVDFKVLPAALARKISYDAEQRLLRFAGIMSREEKAAIEALSADQGYRNAVESLADQPGTITPPDERIWLQDVHLQFPLNDHLPQNLAKAIEKALAYLSKTLSENRVVQQSSAQLGLTEALTRYLLTRYAVLPGAETLMTHFTDDFASTAGVVDYATMKTTFDGWFWANRVAIILKEWKITFEELEKITTLTAGALLLNFEALPLDSTGEVASLERFLRTNRLLRLRDRLPETRITLLGLLENLDKDMYSSPADFAADVEGLNDTWPAADMEALIDSFDLAYPKDYLLSENWERLRRAFYYLDSLNTGADTVKTFAAPAMSDVHAKTLKELLRSRFGTETWLTLSTEIQDVLRERKRDALAAYLLAQPKPADVPSGKWENTNDLYAYYLLDVEMSSCQLTSRLVQGSGSVQLFVQRCFMGLEPDVKADADTGSAWRWWKWMRKYRVWEANRKIFLWPENWIEPELRKDRSPFFKDLENELLQNEINQENVEKAFINYLEKLDGVAQLEIAGFYQEDDGDNAIVHVFGRTKGAEPHIYYYRRYDYRQWTPWEKVDLDIQSDYLIPAVVNKRLFLFWPVFTEVPDEQENKKSKIPSEDATEFEQEPAKKKLRLQMAVSDYRQGKWTPKRISKDYYESETYEGELVKKLYRFIPIDRTEIDGRLVILIEGYGITRAVKTGDDVEACRHPDGITDECLSAKLQGAFEIFGCKGVPERSTMPGSVVHVIRPEEDSVGSNTAYLKWVELGQEDEFGQMKKRVDSPEDDFTLENDYYYYLNELNTPTQPKLTRVLNQTPWIFKMTPPWHLSYMDRLLLDALVRRGYDTSDKFRAPIGAWLPFFYNDKKRTFFVLPLIESSKEEYEPLGISKVVRYCYPDIKRAFRQLEDFFEGQVENWLDTHISHLTSAQRQRIEQYLHQQFPEMSPPPYSDEQLKDLMKRYLMRLFPYAAGILSLWLFQSRKFHFKNFYHPFVCDFAKLVYNPLEGIPALMSRKTQLKNSEFSFKQSYQPTSWVIEPWTEDFYPKETVDFTPDGAYSPYNWELFFHIPLLIANALSKNQRFEEARDWYHFIFNPIGLESSDRPGGSRMSKYWITKPFFETTDEKYVQQRIDNILRMLAEEKSNPEQPLTELEKQVVDWRTNPFEPHRIANYRTVAYQKTVVMKYLDNLIAWGDYLFRQDSMESINEATQLYILAAEILGPRPKKISPQAKPPVESFNELEKEFDKFSNALVEVENLVPVLPGNRHAGGDQAPLPMLYFCIPQNDKMLSYWDTVADRLYKIRHCMNIEGVVRKLALFEPPIEPGALVKAVAGGLDIGSVLADLSAPLPIYRFNVLLQKANEVCNDVKALGSALLQALEKRDAETLGLLRQNQEIRVLESVKAVREAQIEEAKENLEGLKKSKELAEIKKKYYKSREFMNAGEIAAMSLSSASTAIDAVIALLYILAGGSKVVPQFTVGIAGFGGSPYATAETGGKTFGSIAEDAALTLSSISRALEKGASLASTIAGYQRRQDDWDFQKDLAVKEIEQLEKSIAAAELRIAIAKKELDNHLLQIENAKATEEFMRSKYTNEELYQWQVGQISDVYFQSYKLAYDLAKRAERCFRFELGLQESNYIKFGYWDSLKKGLLSGEKLQYDLRRLETAYLEQNHREFELTKHISLALLDPLALVQLRETGRCFINLPEEIFDLDYPGHYFRRIKSVSLTLPCVVGPYTTVSCTLRLLKNSIRINTANGDNGYPHNTDDQGLPSNDDRFIENNIPVKAIAVSNAQNDSGMFELNFRDERYLPFEGAGAISEWSLELFSDLPANNPDPGNPDFGKPLRQFDYSTISDVILHIKYTAREDAGAFKNAAINHLRDYFSQDEATHSMRMFNLRQEFPNQWHSFLHPADPSSGNVFELEMSTSLFPVLDQGKTLKIKTIWLLARCTDPGSYEVVIRPPLPAPPPTGSDTIELIPVDQYGGLHFGQKDVDALGIEITPADPPVKWRLKMTRPDGGHLQQNEVQDVLFVLGYKWE